VFKESRQSRSGNELGANTIELPGVQRSNACFVQALLTLQHIGKNGKDTQADKESLNIQRLQKLVRRTEDGSQRRSNLEVAAIVRSGTIVEPLRAVGIHTFAERTRGCSSRPRFLMSDTYGESGAESGSTEPLDFRAATS